MKENLNEEIKRNRELMGLPVNEGSGTLDKLEDLIKLGYEKIKEKLPFLNKDEDEDEDSVEKDKDEEEETPKVDINKLEKDSEEEKEFVEKLHKSLNVKDISNMSTCNCKNRKLKNTDYFITHHTAGHGSCEKVMQILNNRGPLGVQWIVDREGTVCQSLPLNSVGYHILDSAKGQNNFNSQGVEVVGNDDNDILPIQAVSVLKLVKKLGIKPSQIYGHGEVNPGHRSASEGQTIKKFIQKNYNTKEDDYDFSMFGDRAPDLN